MKKILSLLLSCTMFLTGCTLKSYDNSTSSTIETTVSVHTTIEAETDAPTEIMTEESTDISEDTEAIEPTFLTFDDPDFVQYVEDSVYSELVEQLHSDDYIVESVQAVVMPKEYYEEVGFNSQENIYFGYKVSELNDLFQGTKYIFTVDNNGNTVVQEMEILYDDTYDRIMKNIVVGTAVILVCVTVSVVTGGLGLPAVSAVFAASAETATTFALSSAVIGGASAAMFKGIETGNLKQSFKAATLGASDGFKWGAITGAVVGGASKGIKLAKAGKNVKNALSSGSITEIGQAGEAYAQQFYKGKTQISYLAGEEVSMSMPGATRPDIVVPKSNGAVEAIEVKNYDLKNSLPKLKKELIRQVGDRKINLPEGSTQKIALITKGRGYSKSYLKKVVKELQDSLWDIYGGKIPIDIF